MNESVEIVPRDSRDPLNGRFLKGKSGNPGGRRAKPLTEALLKLLTDKGKRGTMARRIAMAQLKRAEQGSVTHFTAIADRVEGKPEGDQQNSGPTIVIINGNMTGED